MNLTAPGNGTAFPLRPTYINLLLLPCVGWLCIFLHLSALVSKCRGWFLRHSSSFVSPVRVCIGAISLGKKKHRDTHIYSRFHPVFLRGLSRGTVPLDPFYFPYKQPQSECCKSYTLCHGCVIFSNSSMLHASLCPSYLYCTFF